MFKKFIIILSVIFAIFITLIIGLYLYIKPNHYKQLITQSFNNYTSRNLQLDGDIKIKLFPYIGVEVDDIKIPNPNNLPQGNTLTLQKVGISIKIAPLFDHKLIIDKLFIDGLNLNLIKNNAINNWTFKTQHNKQEINNIPQKNESSSEFNLELKNIKVLNSTINYTDIANGQKYSINNINLILPYLDNNSITLNNNSLVLNNLTFGLNNLQNAQLNLNLVNIGENFTYSGNISTPEFSLSNFLKQLNLPTPKLNNPELLEKFKFSSNFFGTKNSANLNDLNITINKNHLSGNIGASSLSPLRVNNTITIDNIDLSDINKINGYKLPLKQIKLNGYINAKNVSTLTKLNQITAVQNLSIANITLIGFDINYLINKLNSIFDIDINKLAKSTAGLLNNEVKSTFEPSSLTKRRNMSDSTNLGALSTNMKINNGIITNSNIVLNGPSLIANGHGSYNLNNKFVNYSFNLKLKSKNKNDFVNNVVFPIQVYGKTDNLQKNVNWPVVLSQIISFQARMINNSGLKNTIDNTVNDVKQGTEKLFNKLFK